MQARQQLQPGAQALECDEDGNYKILQCNPPSSSGSRFVDCYCVHFQNGSMIAGTERTYGTDEFSSVNHCNRLGDYRIAVSHH